MPATKLSEHPTAKATREKGAKHFEGVTDAVASFLQDLAASDLNDMYE